MNHDDVSRWFGEYLDAFAACGRGEATVSSLLAYYGVPLLLTSDDGFVALTTEDQVCAMVEPQIEAMRAAGYDHTDVFDSEVTVLNAASAIYRGAFSRVGGDGAQITRPTLSYLITDGPLGRRISALVVHSPS